jgi:hypothetical protein
MVRHQLLHLPHHSEPAPASNRLLIVEKDQTYYFGLPFACTQTRTQMGTKGNVVLYLDKEYVEKFKDLGFNLSKTFENHLKHLMTQFSKVNSANKSELTENRSFDMGLHVHIPEKVQNLFENKRGIVFWSQTGVAQKRVADNSANKLLRISPKAGLLGFETKSGWP